MPASDPARQSPPFDRPRSAVGLLGLAVLLLLVGLLGLQLLPPLPFGLSLVFILAVPVGVVIGVLALRRMALGLEAVYDHLESDR